MAKRFFVFLFSLLPLYTVFAGISFGGLDLSNDNRLLFRASSTGNPVSAGTAAAASNQHVVFVSRLTDLALQQITAFPEKINLAENGRSLLVRNNFGTVLIPISGGLPYSLLSIPSLAAGNISIGSMTESMAISADGHWLLYIDAAGPAYGNLILIDVSSGRRKLIASQVERASSVPACWSPDSRVFVYSKGGKLFYYPLNVDSVAEEKYRQIGEGKINSVSWSHRGDFFYIRGNTLFHVRGPELFTRAVYIDFLEIGSVAATLPMEFDPDFDAFWIAPDTRSVLISKSGRNIFYYTLGEEVTGEMTLPYIRLPPGSFGVNVLWPDSGPLTVTAELVRKDGLATAVWRLAASTSKSHNFISMESPIGSQYSLSPDGKRVLVWGERGVSVLDYATWKPSQTYQSRPVYSCLWLNANEYIIADSRRIDRVDAAGRRHLICLAGIDEYEYGFEEGGGTVGNEMAARILAKSDGVWYVSDGKSPWAPIDDPHLRRASQVSGRYRVYLEKQIGSSYENLPMIRNTASVGTGALLPLPAIKDEVPLRATPASVQAGVVIRGAAAERKEVALCFDLYDDDTGLSHVLAALNRFGIKATFFLNGNFIRRNPGAALSIAEAGHEAASMFYAPIDISDSRYRINAEYIAKGLARNEDEYFQATGHELALLWHPPFYQHHAEVATAAQSAGYLTVGRDVDPMDWMTREDTLRLGITHNSAPDMIERVMAAKVPGSIIPVRLGMQGGGRKDYLFLSIDVLLESLLRAGYAVVPVSVIAQMAR